MTNPFFTKAIFSWNVPAVDGGNPAKFADRLKAAGFEAVYLKAADGGFAFTPNRITYLGWGENIRADMVSALKGRGIKVIGWQFNYGDNILKEADIAASQTLRFNLDGWIFDIESKFEANTNAVSNAYALCNEYRKRCPSIPLGFCSWAQWRSSTGVLWHNEDMAKAFMEKCDVGMPMMYWGGSSPSTALWLLNESLRLWRNITNKPIIPVGRAYTGDGGYLNAGTMTAFANEVRNKGLRGLSWWLLDQVVKDVSAWGALTAIPKFAPVPEPQPEPQPEQPEQPLEQKLAALEKRVAALEKLHQNELYPYSVSIPYVSK